MCARFVAVMLMLFALCAGASARDTGTDNAVVVNRYLQHFVVEPDGSFTVTVDIAKTIAQPRAIQPHSLYYISYNRSLDDVLTVEAYTQKPDGTRIAVEPAQIRDQEEGASTDAPVFQDTRMKVIVFPHVAVGDRVVAHYVVRRHTPLFPGQFEDLSASAFYRHEQFELIYDVPPSMTLYAGAVGFVPMPAEDPPGRKRYRWRYVNGDNARIEYGSVSYFDYGKRLSVSTFRDYGAFARAFARAAAGMTEPDEAISALAHQVTAGLADPRAKAIALSEWVRRNIRYVGVYVGQGGVVPHPAPAVLRTRYGDCKDHAILLHALLAAAGIDSTEALINAANAYRLPRTPTLGILNHMINYVPSLKLYLDSTAESVSAGYLPSSDLGKPVVLLASGQLAATPPTQPQRNRTRTWFDVQADGRSRFKVSKTTSGAIAEPYRQAVRDTRPADREQFVSRMLQGLGQKGSGVFDPGVTDGSGDEYSMSFSGTSENFINLPGPTGLATSFSFWGGLGETVAELAQEKDRQQDFVCPAIDMEDELGFRLPRTVHVVALPRDIAVAGHNLSYRAAYARKGNTVVVKRSLRFTHDGPVCAASEYKKMMPLLDRMMRDLRSQVVIAGARPSSVAAD
jgi:transglutaminase-like putative cysteine protease